MGKSKPRPNNGPSTNQGKPSGKGRGNNPPRTSSSGKGKK